MRLGVALQKRELRFAPRDAFEGARREIVLVTVKYLKGEREHSGYGVVNAERKSLRYCVEIWIGTMEISEMF